MPKRRKHAANLYFFLQVLFSIFSNASLIKGLKGLNSCAYHSGHFAPDIPMTSDQLDRPWEREVPQIYHSNHIIQCSIPGWGLSWFLTYPTQPHISLSKKYVLECMILWPKYQEDGIWKFLKVTHTITVGDNLVKDNFTYRKIIIDIEMGF